MAYARLQSAVNTGAGASTVTATFGTSTTAGTKIIAFLITDIANTVTSVQDASLNNLTQIGLISGSAGGGSLGAVYAYDTTAGGINPAIKATVGTSGGLALLVMEVSGLLAGNTTAMADNIAGIGKVQETPVSPQAQPAYSSTVSGEMLFSYLGDNGNSVTWTVPSESRCTCSPSNR